MHEGSFSWRRLALLVLVGTSACRQEPPPPAAPAPAAASAAKPDPRLVGLQNMNARVRKIRAEVRNQRKAEFADNYSLYESIRHDFERPDTLAAAWAWVTAASGISQAGDEPGELAWDDRIGQPVISGLQPSHLSLPVGDGEFFDLVWIEPGIASVGSPDTEEYRGPDEQVHQVMIPRGFWIGVTEVTQDLWLRVMGSAPSYFKSAGPHAPVEQVSWYDAQYFLLKLNMMIEEEELPWLGVMFQLPSEAEWEYACRAGTATPVYSGTFTLITGNNAPELDPIAWYGGNSGVTYPGGWDATKWKDTQYPFTTAGTHPVALKKANDWGLYDTIGNVWEWCADAYAAYPPGSIVEISDLGPGSNRVARGASWGNAAGNCRAAVRNSLPADTRHPRVGFRVAASW